MFDQNIFPRLLQFFQTIFQTTWTNGFLDWRMTDFSMR